MFTFIFVGVQKTRRWGLCRLGLVWVGKDDLVHVHIYGCLGLWVVWVRACVGGYR